MTVSSAPVRVAAVALSVFLAHLSLDLRAETVAEVAQRPEKDVRECRSLVSMFYVMQSNAAGQAREDVAATRRQALGWEKALYELLSAENKLQENLTAKAHAQVLREFNQNLRLVSQRPDQIKMGVIACALFRGDGTLDGLDPAQLPATRTLTDHGRAMNDAQLSECIAIAEQNRFAGGLAGAAAYSPFYVLLKDRLTFNGRAADYDKELVRLYEERARNGNSIDLKSCDVFVQGQTN